MHVWSRGYFSHAINGRRPRRQNRIVPRLRCPSISPSPVVPPRFIAVVPPLLHNRGLSTASAIMSNVTEMVYDRKTSPETSSGEIPKTCELDGIEEVNDNYHDHLGVTRNDRRDMSRMGKIQQLRVRGQAPRVRSRFS